MNFNGKTVLITGGGSGLGLDALKQFTKLGARVITCGRTMDKLEKVKSLYPEIEIIQCDLANENDLLSLKSRADELGGIDILYNNAGEKVNDQATTYGKDVTFEGALLEIRINYLAVIKLIELFIPTLKFKPEPIIINTSSVLAYLPSSVMPTYSASKAALHSYTIALRFQLEKEKSNIKVYELMPPRVDTPFNTENAKKLEPKAVNATLISALGTKKYEVRPGPANLLYHLNRIIPNKALKILNASKDDV